MGREPPAQRRVRAPGGRHRLDLARSRAADSRRPLRRQVHRNVRVHRVGDQDRAEHRGPHGDVCVRRRGGDEPAVAGFRRARCAVCARRRRVRAARGARQHDAVWLHAAQRHAGGRRVPRERPCPADGFGRDDRLEPGTARRHHQDRARARDRPRRHPGQPAVPDRRQAATCATRRRRPRSSARRSTTASRSARSRSARPANRGCRCTPIRRRPSCSSKPSKSRATSAPTTSCCRSSATATST